MSFYLAALSSPGKWGGKRKQKPLKNLHSFVTLLATVTSACHKQMNVTENNNNNTTISEKQVNIYILYTNYIY